MGKVYNLSEYIEATPTKITVRDRTFEITDGFNDLLKMQALNAKRDDMDQKEFMQQFLSIAVGDGSAVWLLEQNFPIKFYMELMEVIQKSMAGDDDDEDKEGDVQEGTQKMV